MPNIDTTSLLEAVKTCPQLYSIFDRITEDGSKPDRKRKGLQARTLQADRILEPDQGDTSQNLETSLTAEVEKLETLHPDAQEATYFYLLQKYGWRIGQPGKKEDDLQDIAFCDAVRIQKALNHPDATNGCLLVKGDLSGIQEYIYGNIQQKTAGGLTNLTRRLRGRSIVVSLLSDFLAGVVLKELDLPVWHLLFSGGGHFNLLLPDTDKMRGELKLLSEKLDAEMRRTFDDKLQLILAIISCSKTEILQQAGDCFQRLNSEREKQKYQQHFKFLEDHFFPPDSSNAGGAEQDWEMKVGQKFPRVNLLAEVVNEAPVFVKFKWPNLVSFEMHKYCYSLHAFEEIDAAKNELNFPELVSAQIFSLNSTEFLPANDNWVSSKPISFGFRFIGKSVPFNEETAAPKTFEELANIDKLELLSSVRLDVDDLGYIFKQGLYQASLGQIITLSREMQYFFSAHFDRLAEANEIYLIYSGGDDAFALGQWNHLIDFLMELNSDFDKFVNFNNAMHFSAGVFQADPKYPVGRLYLDTDDLLKEAKKENKNRVNIFNNITTWEALRKKIQFGNDLVPLLIGDGKGNARKLSMAFAYRLLTLVKTSFYETAEIVDGEPVKRGALNKKRFARNIANVRYLFARHGYDEKSVQEIKDKVESQLITDFLRNFKFSDTAEQSIRDNLISLNYALYTIRSQSNTQS